VHQKGLHKHAQPNEHSATLHKTIRKMKITFLRKYFVIFFSVLMIKLNVAYSSLKVFLSQELL